MDINYIPLIEILTAKSTIPLTLKLLFVQLSPTVTTIYIDSLHVFYKQKLLYKN